MEQICEHRFFFSNLPGDWNWGTSDSSCLEFVTLTSCLASCNGSQGYDFCRKPAGWSLLTLGSQFSCEPMTLDLWCLCAACAMVYQLVSADDGWGELVSNSIYLFARHHQRRTFGHYAVPSVHIWLDFRLPIVISKKLRSILAISRFVGFVLTSLVLTAL